MINNTGETPLLGKLHGRIKETFKFLDSEDIKGKVILDIGCGYGWFENEIIKKHPKKIIASEISEADLSTIKKYITNPKIVFKKTSAIDLSINDGTIDTVVSWEVIEHIPDKTEHKMFSEARRVLKPHGSFYLSTPYKGFFSTLLDPAWWLIGHRHYNESAMELFAKYNGFNLVKISDKTKAILPVHLYGAPFQVDVIRKIADDHNLYLVEDAAQSIGVTFKNRQLGTFGDLGIFSFYPGKNLGAYGDGGAISTNDDHVYQTLIKLRNYGQSQKYFHDQIGLNSRMDEIQAAVLRVKLKYIDKWNIKRNNVANQYKDLLKDIKVQKILPGGTSNYHIFMIEHEERDELQKFLQRKEIQTLVHYPRPIHLQKCYEDLGYQKGDFPTTEHLSKVILSLPLYPELNSKEIEYISGTVLEFDKLTK